MKTIKIKLTKAQYKAMGEYIAEFSEENVTQQDVEEILTEQILDKIFESTRSGIAAYYDSERDIEILNQW